MGSATRRSFDKDTTRDVRREHETIFVYDLQKLRGLSCKILTTPSICQQTELLTY